LVNDGKESIDQNQLIALKRIVQDYLRGILGIQDAISTNSNQLDAVMQMLIEMRLQAKMDKNFTLSDLIRDKLKSSGIELMDTKDGSTWKIAD